MNKQLINPTRCSNIDVGRSERGNLFCSNDLTWEGKVVVEKYICELLLLSGEFVHELISKFN